MLNDNQRNALLDAVEFLRTYEGGKKGYATIVSDRLEKAFPLDEDSVEIDRQDLMQQRVNSVLRKLYDGGGDLPRSKLYTDEAYSHTILNDVMSYMVENEMVERYMSDRRTYYRLKKGNR